MVRGGEARRAGFIVDHGPAWLSQTNAPWWLLTHYPDGQRRVHLARRRADRRLHRRHGGGDGGRHGVAAAAVVGAVAAGMRAPAACIGSPMRSCRSPDSVSSSACRALTASLAKAEGIATALGACGARAGARHRRALEPVARVAAARRCARHAPARWPALALVRGAAVGVVVAAWSLLFFAGADAPARRPFGELARETVEWRSARRGRPAYIFSAPGRHGPIGSARPFQAQDRPQPGAGPLPPAPPLDRVRRHAPGRGRRRGGAGIALAAEGFDVQTTAVVTTLPVAAVRACSTPPATWSRSARRRSPPRRPGASNGSAWPRARGSRQAT